ncbi:Ubiquitin-like protein ATG12 [Oopsacas minuta]|uniref:Ubiquitin-like protein ATG12 n=1 Tax=Oopsacas minuta TaxID=111878 RepID=A0AAV7K0N7_9METZ|nr:Ubiquitin-like protein ATG12 [Oopsacas minuta]
MSVESEGAEPAPKAVVSNKVTVMLKPTANAPILKQKNYIVERSRHVGWISNFLKKQIQAEPDDQVFLYINQCFCPSPDQEVGALFDLYESGKKLVLHYCLTPAWG